MAKREVMSLPRRGARVQHADGRTGKVTNHPVLGLQERGYVVVAWDQEQGEAYVPACAHVSELIVLQGR